MNKTELYDLIQQCKSKKLSYQVFSAIYKAKLDESNYASDIYLVRHAETDFNKSDQIRIRSIVDLSLCEDGLMQANQTGIDLRNAGIQCIYSSDMIRAQQTSRAIQLNADCKIELYPQLRSWNLGSWAGELNSEIEPKVLDLINDPDSLPPDSNESYNIFMARNIKGYLDAIQFPGKIAIVTHQSNCIVILEMLGYKDIDIQPGQFIKLK